MQIGRLLSAPVGVWFLTHLTPKTDKTGELVVYKPDLDKKTAAFLIKEIESDPKLRFQTPAEFREALQRLPKA